VDATKRGLDASNAVYSKKAPGRIMMGQHMDKKHTRGGDGMTDMQATKSPEAIRQACRGNNVDSMRPD